MKDSVVPLQIVLQIINFVTQQTDNPGQTTVTVNKPNLTIRKTPNNPKASRDQNISFEIRIKKVYLNIRWINY